jgi:AcrR family transcriptional regulator
MLAQKDRREIQMKREEAIPQTQARIQQAALELFLENGYHGTSMRQIASQAGIALGGIYNHFPSKEALFQAVFDATHPYHDVLPILRDAEGETPEALVRHAAEGVFSALERRPHFLKLLVIEWIEFQGLHASELIQTVFPQGVALIETYLRRQREVRQIPAPILLKAFLGLFLSYYLSEMLLAPAESPTLSPSNFNHYVNIYLHGILHEGNT